MNSLLITDVRQIIGDQAIRRRAAYKMMLLATDLTKAVSQHGPHGVWKPLIKDVMYAMIIQLKLS